MERLPDWCREVVLLDHSAPIPIDRPFTAAQATSLGVSAVVRHRLVQLGLLRPVLRSVFVATQVPDSMRLRLAAAELVVPPHAVVVDRTAAWVHGVDALPRSAIHAMPSLDVFSADEHRVRREGIRSGARQLLPRDVMHVGGLRLTTPLRTACDLGRLLWRFDAIGALDGFLRLGVGQAELSAEVERFKGRRGVVQLRRLVPLGDAGAESPPESALRLHWHEAGDLPSPETQIWEYADDGTPLYRIDVGHKETRYGAEYYGEDFHPVEQEERDDARLAWLEERRGWVMDVFTREHVYGVGLTAGTRLRAGFHRARATLGLRSTTYVDLGRTERRDASAVCDGTT